jgi:hypothetical protein
VVLNRVTRTPEAIAFDFSTRLPRSAHEVRPVTGRRRWIEGCTSDLAVFTGAAGRPDQLKPGRTALAPCVWEAASSHEHDAFSRHVLATGIPLADRIANWSVDIVAVGIR